MRSRNCNLFLLLLSVIFFTSCSRYITETGKASYYANSFDGKKTASGETFHQSALTAAHKTLPFGTLVTVKNLSNGKTTTVRINDRGPLTTGRVIDLSKTAAQKIDMIHAGIAQVQIKYKKKNVK